jgi:hypothetical protein
MIGLVSQLYQRVAIAILTGPSRSSGIRSPLLPIWEIDCATLLLGQSPMASEFAEDDPAWKWACRGDEAIRLGSTRAA